MLQWTWNRNVFVSFWETSCTLQNVWFWRESRKLQVELPWKHMHSALHSRITWPPVTRFGLDWTGHDQTRSFQSSRPVISYSTHGSICVVWFNWTSCMTTTSSRMHRTSVPHVPRTSTWRDTKVYWYLDLSCSSSIRKRVRWVLVITVRDQAAILPILQQQHPRQLGRRRLFCPRHRVQTSSGAHTLLTSMYRR
jgi:hypothetical protein